MRLAYLMNEHPYASSTFIGREMNALERRGMSVTRFSIRHPSATKTDVEDEREQSLTRYIFDSGVLGASSALGLACITSPGKVAQAVGLILRQRNASIPQLIRWFAYLVEACVLVRWCKQEKIQHLHAHFATNPAAVAVLARIMGGPSYSFTVHGPDEFDSVPALGLDIKARHAACVVGISSYGKSQLSRWVDPEDHPRLQVVHCGLDDAFLATHPTPVPDVQRLVFVGRLITTKGVFVLLDALMLLAQRGIRPTVALIGGGPERARIEARIAKEGLQDKVELLGWQSSAEVRQEILRSRALVLPSFAEGLPVVLMEALALARPVVTTWVAGIPELVEPGKSGWLVPPGSADALADALQQVLTTPVAQLSKVACRGREKVLREHDASKEAAKLARLFEQAVEANAHN